MKGLLAVVNGPCAKHSNFGWKSCRITIDQITDIIILLVRREEAFQGLDPRYLFIGRQVTHAIEFSIEH